MTVTDRASTPPSTGATPLVPVPPVLTPDRPAERESTGVTLRRVFVAGASLTVLILLVAIIAGSVSLARLTEARQTLLDEMGPAVRANQSLEVALLNQETGIRGYALTRNAEFLVPYRDGLADEAAALAVLRAYLGDRPEGAQLDGRGAGGPGLAQRVRRAGDRDGQRLRGPGSGDRQDAVRRHAGAAGRPDVGSRRRARGRPRPPQQRRGLAAVGRHLHRGGDRRLPRRGGVGPAPRGPPTDRGARRPGAQRGVGRRAPGGPGHRPPGDRRARRGRRRDARAHLRTRSTCSSRSTSASTSRPATWNGPTATSSSSPMSRATTCRSRCARSPASASSCSGATAGSSTSGRTSTSASRSTARSACSV